MASKELQPFNESMVVDSTRSQNNDSVNYYPEAEVEYRGQPLHISLAQGPLDERRCTDVVFCVIFVLAIGAFGGISVLGFINGDPTLLMEPFDSTGQQCGIGVNKKYPYVYYNFHNTSQFCCINQCPDEDSIVSAACMYGGTQMNCSKFGIYDTTRQIDICYPSNSSIVQIADISLGIVEIMVSDIDLVWPIQAAIVGIALILSIFMLLIVRWIGGCLIWTVLSLYFIGLTVFGFVAYFLPQKLAKSSGIKNPQTFRILAYVSWGVVGISLIVFLCTCKKLKIAVTVLKAAADFTAKNCYVVLVPLTLFILAMAFITFWIFDSIYIYSSGSVKTCGNTPYSCVKWDKNIRGLLVYNFFILFWVCQFFISLSQYIIASTAALWYYSHVFDRHNVRPLCRSFSRAFFYHIGSIALGALILALVMILQLVMGIFHWIMKKSTHDNKQTNGCMKCCFKFSVCCVSCFERFIRFLTRNSFIMMAITGQNFCKSSHHAFYLAIRIVQTYAITNGVCHLIMIFTKLLITGACVVMGFFMMTGIHTFADNLFEPVLPCIMFVVISYVISSLFMDVLGISADTFLYCYSIQLDLHKGSVKTCPPGLMQFIEKYR